MSAPSDSLKRMDQDGFVLFRELLPLDLVERAYQELDALYKLDLEERELQRVGDAHFKGRAGHSILTTPTHLLLDLYGKSPALDRLFEHILTDPAVAPVLEGLGGSEIKLRGFNCTRLTGAIDPAPKLGPAPNPHDWHRDSAGEFGFGIFLSDFGQPNQGTTSFIKESHKFPFCPRWNCLFGEPYHKGLAIFLRLNLFSRLLARLVLPRATGAYGKRGDFYIFQNDTWHGREPNLNGHQGLRVLIGAFPVDMPYPDQVNPLSDEFLQKLPPAFQKAAPQARSEATTAVPKPLMDAMWEAQKSSQQSALFPLARLERKVADRLSSSLLGLRLLLSRR